jgi:hypothetical protein
VDGAVRFNADILAQFIKKIYQGFDTENSIEGVMWREVLRIINEGTVEDLAKAKTPPTHEEYFYKALRHSNEVFAAFKVHTMGQEMAAKLYDYKGQLKPFGKWVEDVSAISSHQVGSWLQTEYDTAVIRAHAAADWREFERNKDILPNLRWMPTTSKEPESSHRAYWQMKLTLPVDDPFWNEHHPGDRWNCKCSLEATDAPVVRPKDMEPTKPQRGLENNPGKDGHTFSDNHPYFPKGCGSCPFNKGFKNKMETFFRNEKKHCYECDKIDNAMKVAHNDLKKATDVLPPAIETYEVSHEGKVLTSPYHGENEVKENKRLAGFIANKIGKKVYLLPRLDPGNPKQAPLRSSLLPKGVPDRKNPDFFIGGMLFDGKSMMDVVKSTDKKKHHNDILNRMKSAKKQADNIVLEIPTFVSRKTISSTVKGFLKQSSKERVVIVKHGNKCYFYNSKYMK